jgi:hypothetical protein
MDMDPALVRQLVIGTVPPGIAGTLLFAAAWWRRPAAAEPGVGHRGWFASGLVVALATLYGVFHALVLGARFPPAQSTDGLVIAAASAAIGAVLLGLPMLQRHAALGWVARIVVIAVVGAVAAGRVRANWSIHEAAILLGGFTLAGVLASAGAESVLRRRGTLTGILVLLVFAAGASQILVLGFSSLKLSQSAGIWAAMLGGSLVAAAFLRGRAASPGLALLVTTMSLAAMWQGLLYTTTPRAWLLIGLVASAPLLAAGGAMIPAAPKGLMPHVRWAAPLVLAIVPVAAAIVIPMLPREQKATDEYDYGY